MTFLRTLGESLQWEDDRVALALFATIAAPQIRLTRDPNTFFFFLDHLEDEPPFRLEDDTTWDTNIERGIYWGLRLIDKDEEIARECRSGEPPRRTKAGATAQPVPPARPAQPQGLRADLRRTGVERRGRQVDRAWRRNAAFRSSWSAWARRPAASFRTRIATRRERPCRRRSIARRWPCIATAGGGRYFELDRESDRDIANAIIDATRRRAERGGSKKRRASCTGRRC